MENRWDAEKAQTERKRLEDEFRANFERLKAERMAREGKLLKRDHMQVDRQQYTDAHNSNSDEEFGH